MATSQVADELPHGTKQDSPDNADQGNPQTGFMDFSKFGPAPDGGLRAWMVAAGGFCIFFSCLGFSSSFGVFQEYYKGHQLHNESLDSIAWIGSVSTFIQFAAGAIGGPLYDRYGAWIMRPAAVLYIIAIMLTSLCREYWQFMLTQGILMGVLMGILQFPAFAAVSQFFDKKRAAALGVVVSGSSVGGIVIPVALSKMLNSSSLGFGWSIRIIGFVITPFMIFACLAIKSRLPPRQTTFFIGAAFKQKKYNLLIASLFLLYLGLFAPLFFIPTYAVSRGIDPTLASYLLAIINAASTFGRIVPGILADKYGRFNIFSLAAFSTGIVILNMNEAKSTAGLIIYSVIYGFTSGTIVSGATAAFSLCPEDPQDIGTYLGMGIGVSSIAALVGPPINGALIDEYGGFLQVSIFSGVVCLAGGCAALLSKATTPQGVFGRV